MNQKSYKKLDSKTRMTVETRAEDMRVGDIIVVHANERVPADLVLLYTTDKSGTVFIRTD